MVELTRQSNVEQKNISESDDVEQCAMHIQQSEATVTVRLPRGESTWLPRSTGAGCKWSGVERSAASPWRPWSPEGQVREDDRKFIGNLWQSKASDIVPSR